MGTAVWVVAIVALLQIGAQPTKAVECEFSAVGSFRSSSTAAGGLVATAAVNLGHCCSLCAASGSCAAINYLEASGSCELVSAQGLTWTTDSSSKLLLKVEIIGTNVPASMQAVSGALIQSGRHEGFTSYVLQKTVSSAHCYSLCKALTSNCRLFAFHMQLLQCNVYDVNFYDTWTNVSTIDAFWTSYYAQQIGSWKLLYKMSKGISVDASNALLVYPGKATASTAQMAQDATCACWLKNSLVDSWSKFPISQVSLVLATAGVVVKYLNFSTTSTDTAATFFQKSKIVAGSWADLTSTSGPTPSIMQIGTPTANSGGRYFQISRGYNGCPGDTGWLSVSGTGATPCSYDLLPVPQFAYVTGTTYDYNVNSAYADALLLYAKM